MVHLAATAALWLERLEGYVMPCILGKGAYGVRSEGRVDVCFEPKFTKFIAGGAEPGFPAREVFRQPYLMGDNGRVAEIKMMRKKKKMNRMLTAALAGRAGQRTMTTGKAQLVHLHHTMAIVKLEFLKSSGSEPSCGFTQPMWRAVQGALGYCRPYQARLLRAYVIS